MANVIDPRVKVIDFGPYLNLRDGKKITPDEFVWGAARITYKDIGTIPELLELKLEEKNIDEKIKSSLIKSAGAGHASMATTPGLWVYLEGNCSKLVDSLFTGIRFGSSLMPSGRRIQINKEQIVVPKKINDVGGAALETYIKTSEKNIEAYNIIQENGVSKQEASKIVHYGHRGGGFLFVPLETVINLSISFDEGNDIPLEGREIISQLEEFIHKNDMGVVYEARKSAPRTGCPNPSVFTNRVNLAQEIINENRENVLYNPVLLNTTYIYSKNMERRIKEFLDKRERVFSDQRYVKSYWWHLLRELDSIVQDYNNSVHATTIANTPWRVWGEVKRHRTLPQTTESVYHAVERASRVVRNNNIDLDLFESVVSVPGSVKTDQANLEMWIERFFDSVRAYEKLIEMGIPKSDAIAIIPRGIKLGIVKEYDLYNLTTGYMSLRLCNSAEPEMRRISEKERELFLNSGLPESVKSLIEPKCAYVGFCPDKDYCGKIKAKKLVPYYNDEMHSMMSGHLAKEIRENF